MLIEVSRQYGRIERGICLSCTAWKERGSIADSRIVNSEKIMRL